MPLLLTLLVCTTPASSAPAALEPAPGQLIRERAWKVTVVGGSIVVAGFAFLAIGAVLRDSMPTDPAVLNTGRAFVVGGVMLAISGALVGLLSIPMWTWRDDGGVTLSLGPLGGAVRW
ncbi:MAG: hypothetical protein JNJ54_23120 [Myxococcaceae bacterium]|nr:hypothetical protein [Myxococcaceae bacterium]